MDAETKKLHNYLAVESIKTLVYNWRENVNIRGKSFELEKKFELLQFIKKLYDDDLFEKNCVVAGGCVEYLNGFTSEFDGIDVFVDLENLDFHQIYHHAYNLNLRLNERGLGHYIGLWLKNQFPGFNFVSDGVCNQKFWIFNTFYSNDEQNADEEFEDNEVFFKFVDKKHPVKVFVKFSDHQQNFRKSFPWNIIGNFDFPTLCGSGLIYDSYFDKFKLYVVANSPVDFRKNLDSNGVERILKYLDRFNVIEYYDDRCKMIIPCLNQRDGLLNTFLWDTADFSLKTKRFEKDGESESSFKFGHLLANYFFKEMSQCEKKEIFDRHNGADYLFFSRLFEKFL